MAAKKFAPDWQPQGGPDMGLTGKDPKEMMNPDFVAFQERFKRVVIPEK